VSCAAVHRLRRSGLAAALRREFAVVAGCVRSSHGRSGALGRRRPMLGSTNASDSSGSAGTERSASWATAIDAENDRPHSTSVNRGRSRQCSAAPQNSPRNRKSVMPMPAAPYIPGAVSGTVNVETTSSPDSSSCFVGPAKTE
jgi:hypothetical protein